MTKNIKDPDGIFIDGEIPESLAPRDGAIGTMIVHGIPIPKDCGIESDGNKILVTNIESGRLVSVIRNGEEILKVVK